MAGATNAATPLTNCTRLNVLRVEVRRLLKFAELNTIVILLGRYYTSLKFAAQKLYVSLQLFAFLLHRAMQVCVAEFAGRLQAYVCFAIDPYISKT